MLPCQIMNRSFIAHYYLSAGEMTMFAQFTVKSLKEHSVGDFANIHTRVIQDCNDAFVLLLHKVHNDLVVEVINLQDNKKAMSKRMGTPVGKTHRCLLSSHRLVRHSNVKKADSTSEAKH